MPKLNSIRLIYRELSSIRPRDRQTDIQTLSQKPFFMTQGASKRKHLMKISKVIFHIKQKPYMTRM